MPSLGSISKAATEKASLYRLRVSEHGAANAQGAGIKIGCICILHLTPLKFNILHAIHAYGMDIMPGHPKAYHSHLFLRGTRVTFCKMPFEASMSKVQGGVETR